MPERGLRSPTAIYETAGRRRDPVSVRGSIVDDLVKDLTGEVVGSWMVFSLCGARVEVERMLGHTAKLRPMPVRLEVHGKTTFDR